MAPKTTKEPEHGGARKGAGRKTNAEKGLEKRGNAISVKLTDAELATLELAAERNGMDLAAFVRTCALAAR